MFILCRFEYGSMFHDSLAIYSESGKEPIIGVKGILEDI